MKKRLFLCLLMATVIVLLAGCQGGNQNSGRKQYDEYLKSLEVKEKNNEENLLDSTKYAFIGELLMKKFYYGTDKKFYMSEKNSPKTLVNDSTNDFGYCQHLLSKITQKV